MRCMTINIIDRVYETAQVAKIRIREIQEVPTCRIPWLLMTARREKPGYQLL